MMSISNNLPTSYQQFIHKSRYARWLDDEEKRKLARNCRKIRFVHGKGTFRKTRLQAL